MSYLDLALMAALLWLPILLFLGASFARGKLVEALLERAEVAAYQTGEWRRARVCTRWARLLTRRSQEHRLVVLESMSQRELGAPERALQGLIGEHAINDVSPTRVNLVVDMLISMGRYREALRVASPILELLRGHEDPAVAGMPALVDINRAEAEYNLGRWAEAEARLDSPTAQCDGAPICHAGSRLQRAWVLAHRGRAEEALALCKAIDEDDLPGVYRTEARYSRAAALIGLARLDEAEEAIKEGLSLAKRTSSERNGLFLLARVAASRARWSEAESLCRRAAEHRWRYQGGDGLLLWGDALVELGLSAEARQAWALAGERDPESESAAIAGVRLRAAA